MKKIAGILAVAAIAVSAFATDVAGKVKITGSLFDYANSKVTVLTLDNGNKGYYPWSQTGAQLSATTDVAGASIVINNNNNTNALSFDRAAIWMKPADTIKLNFGYQGFSLDNETIEYHGSIANIDGNGYGAQIVVDPVTIDVFAKVAGSTAGGSLVANDKLQNPIAAKASFGGDWGKGAIYFEFKDSDAFAIAAGYAGSVDPVSYWVNAKYAPDAITASAFANYGQDNITLKFYVENKFTLKDSADGKVKKNTDSLNIRAYAGYGLDNGMTASVKVVVADALASPFGIVINPQLAGSVGAASWDVGAKFTISGSDVAVAVPVTVQMNF